MCGSLVSVIIPTFNREKELKRAINSVLSQTYKNWEICVIDNFSSDNTAHLVHEYKDSRIKLLMIKNNGVIGASRNHGIDNAKGEYLAFLDSDDWWSKTKLEESVKALNRGASIVYHDLNLVTKNNQKFYFRKAKTRKLKKPFFDDLIQNGNALITSSVVLRKEIFTKVNGFSTDKNFIAIEDYDAWLKLAKLKVNFEKIPNVLGYYWKGGGNTSNPKRTLAGFDTIENKYLDESLRARMNNNFHWLNYNKARAYYFLGMKGQAIYYFKLTLSQLPSCQIKFKCFIMLLIIKIKSIYN